MEAEGGAIRTAEEGGVNGTPPDRLINQEISLLKEWDGARMLSKSFKLQLLINASAFLMKIMFLI